MSEHNKTLNQILDYIGGCEDYRRNAQLITYLEWLTKKYGDTSKLGQLRQESKQLSEANFRQAAKINEITGARHAFHDKLTLLLDGNVDDYNFSVCEAIEQLKAERDKEHDRAEKFMQQVVDTCKRAEKAEKEQGRLKLMIKTMNTPTADRCTKTV